MLSKEEIEKAYWQGYTERDKKAQQICKECKYRKKLKQLEAREQKLIEKLEDLINNKFRAFFEGNTEFPDNATEMKIVKYIKATDLKEIFKILKGEKDVK